MDQAFFLRAKKLLEQRQPARLTHEAFVQAVNQRQGETPTALAASRCTMEPAGEPEALVTLLSGAENWRAAAQIQRGCFSRAVAARRVNTP
jgi:hypothetical protein